MRTLVVSDLHLGCAAAPGVFAGGGALPGLLEHLGSQPLRVVLNGDTFDFTALDEPFAADHDAARQLGAYVEDPTNAPVFAALARVLARGGVLVLRTGEHDAELALAGAQTGLRDHFAAASGIPPRLVFQTGPGPSVIAVGGARVALVHDLVGATREGPPARVLARRLLQPLRRQFGMDFVDLFKPDPSLAALAALAVNPTAAKLVFADAPAASVWRGLVEPARAHEAADLAAAVRGAGLDAREHELMLAALDPAAAIGCEPRDAWQLDLARLKLLRTALGGLSRRSAPTDPISPEESAAARRLAADCGAAAVLAGHTHLAGFTADAALCVVDTGAWVWRFSPPPARDDDAWRRLMASWQRAPRLHAPRPDTPLWTRFTAALLEPRESGGARLELIEWRSDAPPVVHAGHDLPPAA